MLNIGSQRVLGLDIGTSSIGWCLSYVKTSIDKIKGKSLYDIDIVDMGVRIFPESLEAKTKILLNKTRREKRGNRKLLRRRRSRMNSLIYNLQALDMLPKGAINPEYLKNLGEKIAKNCPYTLRAKAIEEPLSSEELGQAIYHLAQRRGFKSNAKRNPKDGGEKPEETIQKIKQEIDQLKENTELDEEDRKKMIKQLESDKNSLGKLLEEFTSSGKETIGQWLVSLPKGERKRERHLLRSLTLSEFNKIIDKQRLFHKNLTDEAIQKLENAIFFQRPLKNNSHLIGFCTFENQERRISRAHYLFQEFSILQDIKNLRIRTWEYDKNEITRETNKKNFKFEKLSDENVKKLFKKVQHENKLNEIDVLDFLDLDPNFAEIPFFKKSSKSKLENTTAIAFSKIFGEENWLEYKKSIWQSYDCEDQEFEKNLSNLVDIMNLDQKQEALFRDLALKNDTKYSNLSKKAIDKIMPEMLDNGLDYAEAASKIYGSHSSLGVIKWDKKYLPSLIEIDLIQQGKLDSFKNRKKNDKTNKYVPSITNPIVMRTLTELKKVVNDILRTKCNNDPTSIDKIVLETARDLAISDKKRKEIQSAQKTRQKQNEKYEKTLIDSGQPINKENVQKVRLWEENKLSCIYCGQVLFVEALFQNSEIEHIIPISYLPDDSLRNKTLSCIKCNRNKGNKTPFEAWGHNPDQPLYNDVYKNTTWNDLKAKLKIKLDDNSEYKKFMSQKKKSKNPPKGNSDLKLNTAKIYRILIGDELSPMSIDELQGFSTRQLNDTRYISTQAIDYLRILFKDKPFASNQNEKERMVHTIKGSSTALIRSLISTNDLLFSLDKDDAQNSTDKDTKNRSDHRHHAIDAFFITLANPTLNQRIANNAKDFEEQFEKQRSESSNNSMPPSQKVKDYFGDDLLNKIHRQLNTNLSKINISYRSKHKISGGLHADTVYGVKNTLAINYATDYLLTKLKRDKYISEFVSQKLEEFFETHGKFEDNYDINNEERKKQAEDRYANAISKLSSKLQFQMTYENGEEYINEFPLLRPIFIQRVSTDKLSEDVKDILDPLLHKPIKEFIRFKNIVEKYKKSLPKKYESDEGYPISDMPIEIRLKLNISNELTYMNWDDLNNGIEKLLSVPFKHPSGKKIKSVQKLIWTKEMFSPNNAPYKAMKYDNNHHCEIYFRTTKDKKGNAKNEYIALLIPTLRANEMVKAGRGAYLGGKNIPLQKQWVEEFGVGSQGQKESALHYPLEYQFLCYLNENDILHWHSENEEEKGLFRYIKINKSNGCMELGNLLVSNLKSEKYSINIKNYGQKLSLIWPSISALDNLKELVTISPSGEYITIPLPERKISKE